MKTVKVIEIREGDITPFGVSVYNAHFMGRTQRVQLWFRQDSGKEIRREYPNPEILIDVIGKEQKNG